MSASASLTDRRRPATAPEPDPAAVLGSLPDPVLVVDADARVRWLNHRAEVELGVALAEARGEAVNERIHPDDLVTATSSLASVQRKDLGTTVEIRVRDRSGGWGHYEVRGWSGIHDHRVQGVVVVLRRLEDRGDWTVAAGDARRRAAVLDHSPGLTLLVDDHSRLQGASRALTSALDTDLESTLGRSLLELAVPEDAPVVREALRALRVEGGTRSFEATLRARCDGPAVPFWFTATDLLDDEAVRAVVISGVDIAELVEARSRLTHQATHDPVTGLANAARVVEQLDLALRRSVGTTARVGVVACEVDGLKRANEDHGHEVGDAVLVEVGRRMSEVLWADDTLGRLGGASLLAVCIRDSVTQVEEAMAELAAAVEEPIATAAGPIRVTLRTGCAVARRGGRADELVRRAEAALEDRRQHDRG